MLRNRIVLTALIPCSLVVWGMWIAGCAPDSASGRGTASEHSPDSAREQGRAGFSATKPARWPAGTPGPRKPPFTFYTEGIQQPATVDAEAADVPDGSLVIGVRLGMIARAYLLSAFEMRELDGVTLQQRPDGSVRLDPEQAAVMSRHVVNDVIAEQPVTVTYCELQECARVLTRPGHKEPLDVGVGGWNDGLLLIIDRERIPQRDADLPLTDVPFELTTWKEWREENPGTDVYIGG